jgi:predicted AlkP superfamily pyrophosphatase or phosphodiesterase
MNMKRVVVLNVVGLTSRLLSPAMPYLTRFAQQGKMARIHPILPAVTSSMQATFLTGCLPREHGIVGNGWYMREMGEIAFWKQANALVQRPKIWDAVQALDATFTCANLFWWFNMYSSVDYAVTPRPVYLVDGRKLPDLYTKPLELRTLLQKRLGQFPLFNFWGPNASLASSKWIANATRLVEQWYAPTLTLVYLPHLDYCLQRFGPQQARIAPYLRELDQLCGELITFYNNRDVHVLILSEYGITPACKPVHINRELRKRGWVTVRQECGREMLDAGASQAFAVADHQIAHIYVRNRENVANVSADLHRIEGIASILDEKGKQDANLDHPRAGDLIAVAEPNAWFTYYYWFDDRMAPDYARTVDIHRKPGYDPVELFCDPQLVLPKVQIGWKLFKKALGFRSLLNIIPLDASLVHGTHGRMDTDVDDTPLFLTQQAHLLSTTIIHATDVYMLILHHLLENP